MPEKRRDSLSPKISLTDKDLIPGAILITQQKDGVTQEIRFQGMVESVDKRGRERLRAALTEVESPNLEKVFEASYPALLRGRVGRANIIAITPAEPIQTTVGANQSQEDFSYEGASNAVGRVLGESRKVFIIPKNGQGEATPAFVSKVESDTVFLYPIGQSKGEVLEVEPQAILQGGTSELEIVSVPTKFSLIFSDAGKEEAKGSLDLQRRSEELERELKRKSFGMNMGDPKIQVEDHIESPSNMPVEVSTDVTLHDAVEREVNAMDKVKLILRNPFKKAQRILNGVYLGVVDETKRALFCAFPEGPLDEIDPEQEGVIMQLPLNAFRKRGPATLLLVPKNLAQA